MSARLTVKRNDLDAVVRALRELARKEVLVGIPASTADREEGDSSPLNNAELGYIHENGSPSQNIPARPFLIPGVEKQKESISSHMEKAMRAALKGDSTKLANELNAVGLVASTGARYEIQHGDFEPLQPATIRNRRKNRKTKSMRESEKKYFKGLTKVSGDVDVPIDYRGLQEESGIQPLINTGQLRDAITYVIRQKGRNVDGTT